MKPRVLLFDIETAPILAYVWGLWDENIGLNQIASDWHVMSWAAKWLGEDEVFYQDQRRARPIDNDKKLLAGIWKLLDEADVVITQNGKRFDVKKLNARFILNGFKPPSPFKHIDTLQIAKKHFAFTSNKLEYMTGKLCTKFKKLSHKEYPGFELWLECLRGDQKAWAEMERYNKHDVLALEELYEKLQPWDNSIRFEVYQDGAYNQCNCGADSWERRGYAYTATGKFQQYRCRGCGVWVRGRENLLSKVKRASLLK